MHQALKYPTTLLMAIVFSYNLYAQSVLVENTDYRIADSIADRYAHHSLDDLRLLADKLTNDLSTEKEKFRSIYRWVCVNIENDYSSYLVNESQRKKLTGARLSQWNSEFSKELFVKLREDKITICTGYAYLIRELSVWAGITCLIVDGYGRTATSNVGGTGVPNHSWNAVLLNGTWYVCDATWSSGVVDLITGSFIKRFDDVYFLPEPSLFVRNHYPLDTTFILLDEKPSLKEFLEGPLVYKSFYKYNIIPIFPQSFRVSATKGETVIFHFNKNGETPYRKIEFKIGGRKIVPHVNTTCESIEAHHVFKRKGKYIVHVLIDSNYTCTYEVHVS